MAASSRNIQWTGDMWELAGDIAGDVVCGGLCIEFGLNGLSSCILGEGRCG